MPQVPVARVRTRHELHIKKSVGPEKSCDFRSGKVVLQQEISAEQMGKLLGRGRTDLLEGFILPSHTNRKFKAFLVRQPDGKIGFEFESRVLRSRAAPARRPRRRRQRRRRPKAPAKKAAVKKTATKTATTATKTATKTAAKKAVKKAAPKKTAA